MAGRLGSVKPREFMAKLKRAGFVVDHQTGSHAILRDTKGTSSIAKDHESESGRPKESTKNTRKLDP